MEITSEHRKRSEQKLFPMLYALGRNAYTRCRRSATIVLGRLCQAHILVSC
jgi:hypothetical protein